MIRTVHATPVRIEPTLHTEGASLMKKPTIQPIALTLVFCLLLTLALPPSLAGAQEADLLSYADAVQRFGSISLTDAGALDLVYRSFEAAGAQYFAMQYKYLSGVLLTLCGGEPVDFTEVEGKIAMLKLNSAFADSYKQNGNLAYLPLDALQAYVQGREAEAEGNATQAYRLYMENQVLDSLDRAFALNSQGDLSTSTGPAVMEVGASDTGYTQDYGFSDTGVSDTPSEPIAFPSEAVKAAVKEAASITVDTVYPANVVTVETLMLADLSLSDLSFLEDFTGLERLYLRDNVISDLSPLANLTNLRVLSLINNQIGDVSALRSLTNLQVLYLDDNPVSTAQINDLQARLPAAVISYTPEDAADLKPTAITYSPQSVSVGDTVVLKSGVANTGTVDAGAFNIQWEIGDYTTIGGHCGVAAGETITDYNSEIPWTPEAPGTYTVRFIVDPDDYVPESDSDPNIAEIQITVSAETAIIFPSTRVEIAVRTAAGVVAGLVYPSDVASVDTLMLAEKSLTDLSFLKDFTGLERLYLRDNEISDLSPLAGLTNLRVLSLINNQIQDVSPLQSLTDLQFLYLEENPVSGEQIDELESILPRTMISYTPEAAADLVPVKITRSPLIVWTGYSVVFNAGVTNAGDADAGEFNIKWLINGTQVGYGGHIGVAAGATETNDNSEYIWTPDLPGTYTIRYEVDTDQHIAESDETNNAAEMRVAVYKTPTATPTPTAKPTAAPTPTPAPDPWPTYASLSKHSLDPVLLEESKRVMGYLGPSRNYRETDAYKPYKMARTDGLFIEGNYVFVDMNYPSVGVRRTYFTRGVFKSVSGVPEVTLEAHPAVTTRDVLPRYGPGMTYDPFPEARVTSGTALTVFFRGEAAMCSRSLKPVSNSCARGLKPAPFRLNNPVKTSIPKGGPPGRPFLLLCYSPRIPAKNGRIRSAALVMICPPSRKSISAFGTSEASRCDTASTSIVMSSSPAI